MNHDSPDFNSTQPRRDEIKIVADANHIGIGVVSINDRISVGVSREALRLIFFFLFLGLLSEHEVIAHGVARGFGVAIANGAIDLAVHLC
jgi:hypothetical protein